MSSSSCLPSVAPGDPSWWFSDALKAEKGRPDSAPLSGLIAVDVAIVGGGFTGLWTALALKERAPHLSIALIEAGRCGSGASGKNGGKVSGYWGSLAGMEANIGADGALAVARAGARAQDAIRAFATAPGRDVWWRDGASIRVSASPAQDAKIKGYVETAKRLGVPDIAHELTPEQVASYCRSPVFRGGVYLAEGATVHPARLARALRQAVIEAGISVYENAPMVGLDAGDPSRIRTPAGEITAREVVLATNIELAKRPDVKAHVSVFSSFALMTEPAPDRLAAMGWNGDEGLADMRMFVHYFRRTVDGRVLMGSGSGPIAFAANTADPSLTTDTASAVRAEKGLRRLLPGLGDVGIAKIWGGGIDVSSDRLPFFRTVPGTRIHYGCGYSGHGVNPTYIGGQCLASLVLGAKDDWAGLPLCTRTSPSLPPEPFRAVGGRLVRWGIIGCEEAEERDHVAGPAMRAAAAIPKLFGLRIGTR
ncbi:FAD-dependent oxidoreductase [Bosea sp. (in: a-proteobacteria)]|uniref:NAD(P)/FAD-dependent oxidoreductase n=1 Tax=Bosea sp. (in: a-proteobacteria) TaxID=1871050 RepID=UPI002B49BCE4|nr:FAD-dependent oxidoreductase [Bosea sp. (in: a-proteobacteria)]WRH56948.1 MAG: FAD-dependent oxidoreductase [Bosea sp. (in: a-proteobacteria)]